MYRVTYRCPLSGDAMTTKTTRSNYVRAAATGKFKLNPIFSDCEVLKVENLSQACHEKLTIQDQERE